MKLRTTSRSAQTLAWLGEGFACSVLYALAVRVWGSGDAAAWYAPEQMRFFLPFAVVFGVAAYETRWDGIVRKVRKDGAAVPRETTSEEPAPCRTAEKKASPAGSRSVVVSPASPSPSSDASQTCESWERARKIPHASVPDEEKDAEYLGLVHQAANEGCVPALEKLGEYARRRGAIVEAYFWISLAEKRGLKTAQQKLLVLRREWMRRKCPSEYENVYERFSESRGSVARALLRMACGFDVPLARQRLRDMASSGHPDACLLVGMSASHVPVRPTVSVGCKDLVARDSPA